MTTWLTPKQAADNTGRHLVTVYRALENGELHGHQNCEGGRWHVHPDSVEAWKRKQNTRTPCCPAKVISIRRAS